MKPNGKSPFTSDYDEKVMFFRDVSPGPHETQLRFRLIHFWEAWNPLKKTLIGLEMLLIDEQGTVIQGFISPGCIERYLPKMKLGSTVPPLLMKTDSDFIPLRIFKLTAIANETSTVISVIPHTISLLQCLMWYLSFLLLRHINLEFCLKWFYRSIITYFLLFLLTHLMNNGIDVVGHMKLVNGQSIIETPILDEVEIARARHVLVHVQSHDGPVMKLYLWDQAARDLCKKFKSYENTSTVLLVTTVNTKSLGGILTLTSCPPHMFLWTTTSNLRSTGWALIHRVLSGLMQKWLLNLCGAGGFFECTATIDDVVHGSTWYYISCSGCHTKATKDPTSLMCSKCGKVNIAGVAQYRAQISVYDNSEQVVFVLLGDAGYELTGKHALELVSSYFEANGNQGVTQEVHVPEALISTIASKVNVDSAEGIKRTCGIDEMGKVKRLKDSSSRLKRRVKVSSASPLRFVF
ncbi:hypothetical protein HID58_062352 [Brassica napus]|uniref:Replication factor A C-terminal domain-containing protein n=1 Tax=Brassica napus TaxID=3708 RepID=A0ABQ8A173_BRANA|nr:hypothetical protein HID58_062352 [Brassica napus]